jgi:hypothetical protein
VAEGVTVGGDRSPDGAAHPGTVEFDDRVEGRCWTKPAAEVPQRIAWVEDEPGRWTAVTRIQTTGTKERREITRFGGRGEFLDVTVQRPRPQARADGPTPTPTPTEEA